MDGAGITDPKHDEHLSAGLTECAQVTRTGIVRSSASIIKSVWAHSTTRVPRWRVYPSAPCSATMPTAWSAPRPGAKTLAISTAAEAASRTTSPRGHDYLWDMAEFGVSNMENGGSGLLMAAALWRLAERAGVGVTRRATGDS